MATSSVDRSAAELGSSSLRVPIISRDTDDGECSPRSPNVRAFVASYEQQQQLQQHRPLCRTDGVGRHHVQRYHHERPLPPCKTTTAVLKVLLVRGRIACAQCIDASYCYICRSTQRGLCVCLCVGPRDEPRAKTAEPNEMPFWGGRFMWLNEPFKADLSCFITILTCDDLCKTVIKVKKVP